jgi:hypothetical protein
LGRGGCRQRHVALPAMPWAMGNDWLQFFCTATLARVKIGALIHEKSVGYLVTARD